MQVLGTLLTVYGFVWDKLLEENNNKYCLNRLIYLVFQHKVGFNVVKFWAYEEKTKDFATNPIAPTGYNLFDEIIDWGPWIKLRFGEKKLHVILLPIQLHVIFRDKKHIVEEILSIGA